MNWTGPYQLRSLLDCRGGTPDCNLPPESPGLYVITERAWTDHPAQTDNVLYVGKSVSLRSRIGDFISSLCGFHGIHAGRHSGGISMNEKYVRQGDEHNPLDIWIAWLPMQGALKGQLTQAEAERIQEFCPRYVIRPAAKSREQ